MSGTTLTSAGARSMTGYARVRRQLPEGELALSLKSVNHRGLDLHFHLPAEFEHLEAVLRSSIKTQVSRGHVEARVSWTRVPQLPNGELLQTAVLDRYVAALQEAAARYGMPFTLDAGLLLRVPGALLENASAGLPADMEATLLDAAQEALGELNCFRREEGQVIADEIAMRLRMIRRNTAGIAEAREAALPAFHTRLQERLRLLLGQSSLEPQRLAQEAALLVDRSDISEEVTRMGAHQGQVEELMAQGPDIGKKLDFLMQEMNRETNTMLAKSTNLGEHGLTITRLALATKSEIEKIREQSLNLE